MSIDVREVTKEAVARQFFIDFVENSGDTEEDPHEEYPSEESLLVVTDWFFSGLMEIGWNPRKHMLVIHFEDGESRTGMKKTITTGASQEQARARE
jgi:hypothetical protein